jgi:hypothetical protein
LDAIALALCIRLDSSELESNATTSAVGTKVFADFWREQLIQCQIMNSRRKEKGRKEIVLQRTKTAKSKHLTLTTFSTIEAGDVDLRRIFTRISHVDLMFSNGFGTLRNFALESDDCRITTHQASDFCKANIRSLQVLKCAAVQKKRAVENSPDPCHPWWACSHRG